MHELFLRIEELFVRHAKFNKIASRACQAFGYNGFKRLHRKLYKCLCCWSACLGNEYYDYFRTQLEVKPVTVSYTPLSLKDHIAYWDNMLAEAIDLLGKYNREYTATTGIGNCYVEKALCKFKRLHCKTGRWYKRFEESGWLVHDMHILDDWLHAKMKKKEKKKKYKGG